jgi:YD repeat-containing protein
METFSSRAIAGSDRRAIEHDDTELDENPLRSAAAELLSSPDRLLRPTFTSASGFTKETLVLFEPPQQAGVPKEDTSGTSGTTTSAAEIANSPDGGKWQKSAGSWKYYDAAGKEASSGIASDVTDVKAADGGGLILSLKDGSKIKQKSDRSQLTYDSNDRLLSAKYPDGSTRQFTWDGDNLSAVRGRDNNWFDRGKDTSGSYTDSWTPRGQAGAWTGKIEVENSTGAYVLTAAAGDTAGVRNVYRTDLIIESQKQDGSKELLYPNKAKVSCDDKGRAQRFVDENGRIREFGWSADDKVISMTVRPSAQNGQSTEVHNWEFKDGSWLYNGAKCNNEISVEKGSGIYTNVDKDKGETYTVYPDGRETRRYEHGPEVRWNHGRLIDSTKGDQKFSYEYDSSGVLSNISLRNDGKVVQTYSKNSQGAWVDDKGKLHGQTVEQTTLGEPLFVSGETKTRVDFQGKSYAQRVDSRTKAVIEVAGDSLTTRSVDGNVRQFTLASTSTAERPVPISEKKTINGKVENWTREKSGEAYTDKWTCAENNKSEQRKNLRLDSGTGELFYDVDDKGTKFVGRSDGSGRLANEAQKWHVESKDGLTTEVRYADGSVRQFGYDSSRQVNSLDISSKDSSGTETKYHWDRIDTDKWKRDDKTVNWHVEANGDKYEITDLDKANEKTIRFPNGVTRTETPASKKITESVNDQMTYLSIDGKERVFGRNSNGVLNSILDKPADTLYERQSNGSWTVKKADGSAKADDKFERVGEPFVTADGQLTFRTKTGEILQNDLGTAEVKTTERGYLGSQIAANEHLTADQKRDFNKDLDVFEQRKELTEKQQRLTLEQINRILQSASEKPFTAPERANLARQLGRHVASPPLDAQGAHPTCNVSDVRLCLERQQPELFAKVMADVITTGAFKTADGTVIRPPVDSLAPGAEERTFPPAAPGARTWLGQISDVTLTNIHWMRRTSDNAGNVCKAGAIQYEELRPNGQGESGSRLFRYEQRTDAWYRQRLVKAPGLHMSGMIDIYSQITGENEAGRGIVHSSRTGGSNVTTVKSVEELKTALGKGPWPKIVQLQNDVLYNQPRNGRDHEHVVVVVQHVAKDGQVLFDNTHAPSFDRLTPGNGVTVDQLYKAMSAPFGTSTDADENTGYWYNGMYFQRQVGLEKFNGKTWEPVYVRTQ